MFNISVALEGKCSTVITLSRSRNEILEDTLLY